MPSIDGFRARRQARYGAMLLRSDPERAEQRYRRAVALDPSSYDAWFEMGLLFKWARRWDECFDCNLRAAELIGERRDEPAWWNLGIAATALHRWDAARRAWSAYGIDLPPGDGPIDGGFGTAAVRLHPQGPAEVVWGDRIDPARMRIISVPLPESGHRWGDIVLHDGDRKGSRTIGGVARPVFDELERWAPSDVPTLEATVTAPAASALDELLDRIVEAGHEAEDWTANVGVLCNACSTGTVCEEHPAPVFEPGREHRVGIAGPLDAVTEIVRAWETEAGRSCLRLEPVG